MGEGREAEFFVAASLPEYSKQWEDSLMLRPLEGAVNGQELSVRLTAPEVVVVELA